MPTLPSASLLPHPLPRLLPFPPLSLDKAQPRPPRNFAFARNAERHYARQLARIARHIRDLADGFNLIEPEAAAQFSTAMSRYSDLLRPWAQATATAMLEDVNRRDRATWMDRSRVISQALRSEIANAPTGQAMRALLDDQVGLITSLPTEAAQRVHKLVREAQLTGTRANVIAQELARTGEVTRNRADLIARTEVSRAASTLTQARAQHVGSTHYVWKTTRDGDVRPSHRKMQGLVVAWNDPPTLDKLTGHAGCLPRCRCYPDPILPE